ncbi:ATP-binding cassette domain-containing protein [bacterium]|nr:ATP-binding cassette domain-containing protein [bacterium]MBU1153178.1 ATP-binding cassette domain-containing protein [bacterium]
MLAVETTDLTKVFNGNIAVNKINLQVKEGELLGLLGPNGAGKTTIISILCTLIKPSSGTAYVWNYDVVKQQDKVRSSIGIVFQDSSLDEELTAFENIDFHGRLYKIPLNLRKKKIEELLRLVGLDDKRDKVVKTFSGGMRRRLEIARGLLHFPKVLFLDEPTLGLDPQTKKHIWDYIKRLKEEGMTIILTTHCMDEADNLCDQIAIMNKGEIIALDTPFNLKNNINKDMIILEVSETKEDLRSVLNLPYIHEIKIEDNKTVRIFLNEGESKVSQIIEKMNQHQIKVNSLRINRPTLDDVYLYYTGKEIKEDYPDNKIHLRERLKLRRRKI